MDCNNGEVMESVPEIPMRRPLLHTSCLLGDEENVKRLISGGVDLNELDFAGCTCTQLSAAAGFINIVKLLVANGAFIENKDASHGNTALHEASWRGYSDLVKLLSNPKTVDVQNNGGFTPLHLACQAGHNQCTRELLLAGINPNLVNTYGDTALHTAVRYGHAGVTRILLSARALTDIQNKNGDTSLHISSAMGRKKLTKILLSAGCPSNVKNNQAETPLDISLRKNFAEVTQVIQNPPSVMTPIQRDEMRASKFKVSPAVSNSSKTQISRRKAPITSVSAEVHPENMKVSSRRSNLSSQTESRSKSTSSMNVKEDIWKKESRSSVPMTTETRSSSSTAKDEVPKWSPYGCHNQPNPAAFPPPNIDSLPKEPLTTGELYYLDLAGNIHKGPMGVSEGCYCGPLLSQSQNSQSLVVLNRSPSPLPLHHDDIHRRSHKERERHSTEESLEVGRTQSHPPRPIRDMTSKYEDQLTTLTHQLSKIHMDTQAQLSSLHSMLHERLKDKTEELLPHSYDENETQLKDWVRQYRRFRKELTKNPKTLQQANELLASASSLLSTRLPSPAPPDSETDSGL